MDSLAEGLVVTVTIDRVTDYGYYVRYHNSPGLLKLTEISWDSRLKSEALLRLYRPKDHIKVKIRHCTPKLFYCSAIDANPEANPWLPDGVLQVGVRTTGIVRTITEYGWFLDLDLPASALLLKQSTDKVLMPGTKLSVVVTRVDRERMRLEVEVPT